MVSKTTKKQGTGRKILFRLVFVFGFMIFLYPVISRWRYTIRSTHTVEVFEKAREALNVQEIQRRIGLAEAYNEALLSAGPTPDDPYANKRRAEGVAEYARMLELHEQIGHVRIPKLLLDLPIYAGSSETVLQKGAGHLEGTSLPVGGNSTHTVITAHRGLPEATLFSHLDRLEVGDRFYISNLKEVLAYQVDQVKTVRPDEREALAIVPGHDYATLLTCTPYMINSHRLLVRGHRIPYVQAVQERELADSRQSERYQWLFYAASALFLVMLLLYLRLWRRQRAQQRRLEQREGGSP